MAVTDEPQASYEHLHEIAEKIRALAWQTRVGEAREELFDLADRVDRMADLGKKAEQ